MKKASLSIALLFVSVFLFAQTSPVFSTDAGAIRGYDPVAFFKAGKAVPGNKSFEYEWTGAKWYFSSADNLAAFKADPGKFAPQYGGYCAYGTATGHKAPTETDTWTIVNDKLYFNYNKNVRAMWMKDQKELIEKADKNWPMVRDSKE